MPARALLTVVALVGAALVFAFALVAVTGVWLLSPGLRRREERRRVAHAALWLSEHHERQLTGVLTLLGQWWLLLGVAALLCVVLMITRRKADLAVVALATPAVLGVVLLGKLLLIRSNTNKRWGLVLSGFRAAIPPTRRCWPVWSCSCA